MRLTRMVTKWCASYTSLILLITTSLPLFGQEKKARVTKLCELFGAVGLFRVSSAELVDKGIRVNAISPGAIGTPLWSKIGLPEEVLKSAGEAITNQIPMKRWGQPEEIAKTVLFLASGDSSYIVGNELTVDGGLRQI